MFEQLNHNGKPLAELDLNEILDYEKLILKRILQANQTGMSIMIQDQLQAILEEVRHHKAVSINQDVQKMKPQESTELIIGEPQQEQSDDTE